MGGFLLVEAFLRQGYSLNEWSMGSCFVLIELLLAGYLSVVSEGTLVLGVFAFPGLARRDDFVVFEAIWV